MTVRSEQQKIGQVWVGFTQKALASPGKPKPLLSAQTKLFKVTWEVTISQKNFLAFCNLSVSGWRCLS